HSQCFRHAVGAGQVMVGNDQVHTQPLCRFSGSESADAHIHADDQTNAGGGGALDHVVAQVVAFANAVRNVEVGRASAELNRSLQNDHRHGAINIVVAVNQDGLFALDGRFDAGDSGGQSTHLLGRVQVGERRREATNR